MTSKECTKLYFEWERYVSGQILIDGIWEDIVTIRKDVHRGWLCKTLKGNIELSSVDLCHIQF